MKTYTILMSAAGLLFAASASHAAPTELQHYADRASATARALLCATGLDFKAQSVSVRATVDPDGRMNGLGLVRSSGSRDTDLAVKAVLKKVVETDPPIGLTGGAVTLNVHDVAEAKAKAP